MTRIVLASESPARLRLLNAAGVAPVVVVSGVDERAVLAAHVSASEDTRLRELARAKATAAVGRIPSAVAADAAVVGCDSMLIVDGRLHGKPASAAGVYEQWDVIAGRSAVLLTGHWVIRLRDGVSIAECGEVGRTTVRFGRPNADELAAYVASGEPLVVAGAFTLDGLGSWFIQGIEGDPSNVIGLSLPVLRALLERCGLSVAQIWASNGPTAVRDQE